MNLAIQDQGWKLDFTRFRRYLSDKYDAEKVFLFIGYVPGNEALYTSLQQAGYTVVFKPTLEFKREGERVTKGNVDAELVLHAMVEYPHYDKAIIVSGDGDFHCLIEYLEQRGKLLHVLIPNPAKYSALLRKFHPYFASISALKKKLSYHPAQPQKGKSDTGSVKAPARPNRNIHKVAGQSSPRRSGSAVRGPGRSQTPDGKPAMQVRGAQRRRRSGRGRRKSRRNGRGPVRSPSSGSRQAR